MNSLKRFMAVFLAVLMIASIAVTCVLAEGTTTADFTVNAKSNYCAAASRVYGVPSEDTITVNYYLRSEYPISNIQGYLAYDSSVLALESFALNEQFPEPVYNPDLYNKVTFNSTNTENSVVFTEEGTLATATFKILSETEGTTDVTLTIEELNNLSQLYETVPIIADSAVVDADKVGGSADFKEPETPTEPTTPTEPVPETTITVKAAKAQIYVGATTTVTATVTNASGATTFTSGDAKVIKVVKVSGNVATIKGLKAGTATITAKNNGKTASVKIKAVKKANPMKVTTAKKTVKFTAVKKKAQVVKAVTVKSAQGKVTYKKKSGNSKFTVNKTTGKITVKKGTKKGTYAIKVSVTAAGTTAYNAATKTVTAKIVIK